MAAVGSDEFLEQWNKLDQSKKSPEDRVLAYLALSSYLKEKNVAKDFIHCLCHHQSALAQTILADVSSKSCDHAALHLLGYCLHQPQFTSAFSDQETSDTVKVLCDVIRSESTSRNTCTRALWCLANQNFNAKQLAPSVPLIVEVVSGVVMSHRFDTPVVDAESLNIFISLQQLFRDGLADTAAVWYRALVQLMLSKVPKMQRKALNLAVMFEKKLKNSHEVVSWLAKELKEKLVNAMVKQLGTKGQEHCTVLNLWAHFVTVLGKVLHRHGSFINELLRVVEMGFKHRNFIVQVAAYQAWKSLISNFATDIGLITSQKRLKLLLMPLLASAVKDRHEQVENSRLQVWWHLIGCLGDKKPENFKQVCVPFLLFCLGVDPKSEMSELPTAILANRTKQTATTASHDVQSSGKDSPFTPTQSTSSAPKVDTPTSQLQVSPVGSLFLSATTPPSLKSSKGSKSGVTTSLPMVLSGCQAALYFLGISERVGGCLIREGSLDYSVFPLGVVPLDVAEFLTLFLDALNYHFSHHHTQVKGNAAVNKLISSLFNIILCSVQLDPSFDVKLVSALILTLLQLAQSPSLLEQSAWNAKINIIFRLSNIPQHLWLAVNNAQGPVLWKVLLENLFQIGNDGQNFESDTFFTCYKNLVTMATNSSVCLAANLHIAQQLDSFVKQGGWRVKMVKLWTFLARRFIDHVKETSEINSGTTLEPDFSAATQILKIPFFYHLNSTERVVMTNTVDIWKELYDVVNIHASLYIKEPNVCAELVCNDLYSAYGHNARVHTSSLHDRGKVTKFDTYQNAVAMAMHFVASKVNWGSLKGKTTGARESTERSKYKRVQPLISLLSWQLATFWDTTRQVQASVHLGQLVTPFTISDILLLLYSNFPSAHVMQSASEVIAEPLANLWEAILTSEPAPTRQRARSTGKDLHELVVSVWRCITTCFQARYHQPFSSALLSILSPLLIVTLSSSKKALANQTLVFWSSTFAKAQHLEYPDKLRETLAHFRKGMTQPADELKLPGFYKSKEVRSVEDSLPMSGGKQTDTTESQSDVQTGNETDASQFSVTQTGDEISIVLPNPSPRKGVMGSFLNRVQSPKRTPVRTPEKKSPAAKAMDDILEKSRERVRKEKSASVEGGVGSSVRRKLPLGGAKEYVPVSQPAKKRRLLTEHQKEKLREKSDIPALYNALDPSQDASSLPPFSEDSQSVPVGTPSIESATAAVISGDPTLGGAIQTEHLPTTADQLGSHSHGPTLHGSHQSVARVTPTCSSESSPDVIIVGSQPAPSSIQVQTSKPTKGLTVTAQTSDDVVLVSSSRLQSLTAADPCPPKLIPTLSLRSDSQQGKGQSGVAVISSSSSPHTPQHTPSALGRVPVGPPTMPVRTSTVPGSLGRVSVGPTVVPVGSPTLPVGPSPVPVVPSSVPVRPAAVLSQCLPVNSPQQQFSRTPVIASPIDLLQTSFGNQVPPVLMGQVRAMMANRSVQFPLSSQQSPQALSNSVRNARDQLFQSILKNTIQQKQRQKMILPHIIPLSSKAPPVPLPTPTTATRVTGGPIPTPSTATRVTGGPIPTPSTATQVTGGALFTPSTATRVTGGALPTPSTATRVTGGPIPTPSTATRVTGGPLPTQSTATLSSTPIALLAVNQQSQETEHYVVLQHEPADSQPSLGSLTPTVVASPTGSQQTISSTSHQADRSIAGEQQGKATSHSMVPKSVQSKLASDPLHTGVKSSLSLQRTKRTRSNRKDLAQAVTNTPSELTHGDKHAAKRVRKARSVLKQDDSTQSCELAVSVETRAVIMIAESETGSSGEGREGFELEDPLSGLSSKNSLPNTFPQKSAKPTRSATKAANTSPTLSSSVASAAAEFGLAAVKEIVEKTDEPLLQTVQALVQEQSPEAAPSSHDLASTEVSTIKPVSVQENEATYSSSELASTEVSAIKPVSVQEKQFIPSSGELASAEVCTTEEDLAKAVPSADESLPSAQQVDMGTRPAEPMDMGTRPAEPSDSAMTSGDSEASSDIILPSSRAPGIPTGAEVTAPLQELGIECDSETRPLLKSASDSDADVNALQKSSVPHTPTHHDDQAQAGAFASPRVTPAGILKYTSQFDTPLSVAKGRRVQFARDPLVILKEKTPKHSRSPRTPSGGFSSRRTLQMSQTSPRMVQLKPPATPSKDPVYPSLADCSSPVEQIVPVLSPASHFTHGLLHLVRARNIRTIGNMSSLSEEQVQTLPIKSPKVETLKNALRSFEQQLTTSASKRRPSVDSEPLPPSKVQKIDIEQALEKAEAVDEESSLADSLSQTQKDNNSVTFSTPDSQELIQKDVDTFAASDRQEVIESSEFDRQGEKPAEACSRAAENMKEGDEEESMSLIEDTEAGVDDRAPEEKAVLLPPQEMENKDNISVTPEASVLDSSSTHHEMETDYSAPRSNIPDNLSSLHAEPGVLKTETPSSPHEMDIDGNASSAPEGGEPDSLPGIEDSGASVPETSMLDTSLSHRETNAEGNSEMEIEGNTSSAPEGSEPDSLPGIEDNGSCVPDPSMLDASLSHRETETRGDSSPALTEPDKDRETPQNKDGEMQQAGIAVSSSIKLDHSYCSQDQVSSASKPTPSAPMGNQSQSLSFVSQAHNSKLSSSSGDHTYCNVNPESQEVGLGHGNKTSGSCRLLPRSNADSSLTGGRVEVLASGVVGRGSLSLLNMALSQELFSSNQVSETAQASPSSPDGVNSDVGFESEDSSMAGEEARDVSQQPEGMSSGELASEYQPLQHRDPNLTHSLSPRSASPSPLPPPPSLQGLISTVNAARAVAPELLRGASARECLALQDTMLAFLNELTSSLTQKL